MEDQCTRPVKIVRLHNTLPALPTLPENFDRSENERQKKLVPVAYTKILPCDFELLGNQLTKWLPEFVHLFISSKSAIAALLSPANFRGFLNFICYQEKQQRQVFFGAPGNITANLIAEFLNPKLCAAGFGGYQILYPNPNEFGLAPYLHKLNQCGSAQFYRSAVITIGEKTGIGKTLDSKKPCHGKILVENISAYELQISKKLTNTLVQLLKEDICKPKQTLIIEIGSGKLAHFFSEPFQRAIEDLLTSDLLFRGQLQQIKIIALHKSAVPAVSLLNQWLDIRKNLR